MADYDAYSSQGCPECVRAAVQPPQCAQSKRSGWSLFDFQRNSGLPQVLLILAPFFAAAVAFNKYVVIPAGGQSAVSLASAPSGLPDRNSGLVTVPVELFFVMFAAVAFVVATVTAIVISGLIERKLKGE
jgi:hypothetical protein